MQRIFIIIAIISLLLALLWPLLSKLGLGRLPGDIVIEKNNFKFYFPITTAIIFSLVISFLLWLFRKF